MSNLNETMGVARQLNILVDKFAMLHSNNATENVLNKVQDDINKQSEKLSNCINGDNSNGQILISFLGKS